LALVPKLVFTPPSDSALSDDIRQLFEELEAALPPELRAQSGQCQPAVDVLETDEAVEVVVDVCGVPPEALRVFARSQVLLIVGEKAPGPSPPAHAFHLVEREFGRFARAVPLTGAFEIDAARASLRDGELTVYVPKRSERRGQGHRVPVLGPGREPA
jgi:HSP20 family protein